MKNWYVEFGINGERLLTIEPDCVGGDPNIGDYADDVRTAAKSLMGFVGTDDYNDDYLSPFPSAKTGRHRSKKYMAYICTHPCLICGAVSEPHHESTINGNGMGIKPDDALCLPLCRMCHSERHSQGFDTFWQRNGYFTQDVMREQLRLIINYIKEGKK